MKQKSAAAKGGITHTASSISSGSQSAPHSLDEEWQVASRGKGNKRGGKDSGSRRRGGKG